MDGVESMRFLLCLFVTVTALNWVLMSGEWLYLLLLVSIVWACYAKVGQWHE